MRSHQLSIPLENSTLDQALWSRSGQLDQSRLNPVGERNGDVRFFWKKNNPRRDIKCYLVKGLTKIFCRQ